MASGAWIGHAWGMRICMILGALALVVGPLAADEIPDVAEAIPDTIRALGEPEMFPFIGGLRMAVMTSSEKAQDHVNQGLNHLHGGWETEAARHFGAAMMEDPECLLAHWGMVMSLLTPSPETGPARNAATDRLLELVDAGRGSELERGYAYALIKYIEEGPSGAAEAFGRVSRRFPNDVQSPIFEALFSRGGFDDLGQPTPDQERSERILEGVMEKHEGHPLPIHALLMLRADGLDLHDSLKLARELSTIHPDYAPYLHMLGHYEWRCGNHARAAVAFGRASEVYQKWMDRQETGVEDCAEWIRSESYRIVALSSRGYYEAAFTAARELAETKVAESRVQSPGARALWWEARTLPARLFLRGSHHGDFVQAQASLPTADEVREYRDLTLASWWIDGFRIALESRRLMAAGDHEQARHASEALSLHGERMAQTQTAASMAGERSAWNRAFRGLEVIAAETRGMLAMMGPEALRGTAFNWFRGATDRQRPATMMYPPAVLTPMALRLGDFHMSEGNAERAIEAYEEALVAFPSDMTVLVGLLEAAEAAEDEEKMRAAKEAILALRES